MIVSFCGHRDIECNAVIMKKMYDIIEKLIYEGETEFFLGGYGNFDNLANKVVNSLKEKYPFIKNILIIPYLERKYDFKIYDEVIYPPLEQVPKKYAILKRNEWMIKKSDTLIAYVKHPWGGAAKMMAYAAKNNVKIINLYNENDVFI